MTLGRHERRRATRLLTADMKRVVEEQRLGFVATVVTDGGWFFFVVEDDSRSGRLEGDCTLWT